MREGPRGAEVSEHEPQLREVLMNGATGLEIG
jgi:hypothetical protein